MGLEKGQLQLLLMGLRPALALTQPEQRRADFGKLMPSLTTASLQTRLTLQLIANPPFWLRQDVPVLAVWKSRMFSFAVVWAVFGMLFNSAQGLRWSQIGSDATLCSAGADFVRSVADTCLMCWRFVL